MGFEIEGPAQDLREKAKYIEAAEKELAALKQEHPCYAQEHAENAARAKMKGAKCEKPAALVTMEARMQELEEFLPTAREILRKDQAKFAQAAAAYLRTKLDKQQADAKAKLEVAYGKVAMAIEELAGIVGAEQARDVLMGGQHSHWIRERLQKVKLPDSGLLQQAMMLESAMKNIAESQGRGAGGAITSRAALFAD